MDYSKAKYLEKTLAGKIIKGYKIPNSGLINNGKSAAVFKAESAIGEPVALKIFDNEIVEKFGHKIQEIRIEKEIGLAGHSIPNLVKIIEGGKWDIDVETYYYIVMEYLPGDNLKDYIERNIYGNSFIKEVTKALHTVCEELLSRGMVHRDIKPENIMVKSTGEVILMDLGVLKFVDTSSVTDGESREFVGTLRYAPREFLLREEEDTVNGWRAVNLYQIGGVLHDLIMKKALFHAYSPYGNLVKAILDDAPTITSNYSFATNQLVRDLLIKNWRDRLKLCPANRITAFYSQNEEQQNSLGSAADSLFSVFTENTNRANVIMGLRRNNEERKKMRGDIASRIINDVGNSIHSLKVKGVFTKIDNYGKIQFPVYPAGPAMYSSNKVIASHGAPKIDNYDDNTLFFKLEGDYARGYKSPLYLVLRIQNDENSVAIISAFCMFIGYRAKPQEIHYQPSQVFIRIAEEKLQPARFPTPDNQLKLQSVDLFNGTISFDIQFRDFLSLQILKLIKTALLAAKPEVEAELDRAERRERGEKNVGGASNYYETSFYCSLTE